MYSYKKQFIDYITSIRENCSVLNESFEGYIVLENRLNNVNLDALFVYNNTLLSSSYPDNTLETSKVEDIKDKEETKPNRTIIKPEINKDNNMTDEILDSYWCYATSRINNRKIYRIGENNHK